MIDIHTVTFVLQWMKEHPEVVLADDGLNTFFLDMENKETITDGELIDLIQNDYEKRNKQQSR